MTKRFTWSDESDPELSDKVIAENHRKDEEGSYR